MSAGVEWIVDARDCLPVRLADVSVLRAACDAVVETLGLRVIGAPQWHRFDGPGGVTGLYLLAESHLCCHTWPEHGTAAFNLFCCRPRPEFPWDELLGERLGAVTVDVRRAVRLVRDEPVPARQDFVLPPVSAGAAP